MGDCGADYEPNRQKTSLSSAEIEHHNGGELVYPLTAVHWTSTANKGSVSRLSQNQIYCSTGNTFDIPRSYCLVDAFVPPRPGSSKRSKLRYRTAAFTGEHLWAFSMAANLQIPVTSECRKACHETKAMLLHMRLPGLVIRAKKSPQRNV